MQNFLSWVKSSAGTFFIMLFLVQFISGIYSAKEIEASGGFVFITRLILVCLLLYWFRTDSRKTGFGIVIDMGFFIILAWPILLPYYLYKTRRLKGILIILATLFVIILPFTIAFLVFSDYGD